MNKKTRDFLTNKFKHSLKEDLIFWLSTAGGVGFAIMVFYTDYIGQDVLSFIRMVWPPFGLWVGACFLVTRNYDGASDIRAQHLKAFVRVILLASAVLRPLTALGIIPALIIWFVIETNKRPTPEETKKPTSKLAMISLICSSLAIPLLFGITTIQTVMINSGLIHRREIWADTSIGFWIGLLLAVAGVVLWSISRRREGRTKLNFWAMRVIVVNVILSPIALIFILAIAITRSK